MISPFSDQLERSDASPSRATAAAPPVAIRYRLPILPLIVILGAVASVVLGLGDTLIHPEYFSSGGRPHFLAVIAGMPPMWRTLTVVVLGVAVSGTALAVILRLTDDEDDFVLDRRGITEIGLFSRRFVRWIDVDQIVIDRQSRRRSRFLAPWMDIYLRSGSSPEVEASIPGLAWLRRIRRAKLTIAIAACDMAEAELVAAVERFRPGILITEVNLIGTWMSGRMPFTEPRPPGATPPQ